MWEHVKPVKLAHQRPGQTLLVTGTRGEGCMVDSPKPEDSVYQVIGGAEGVRRIVERFMFNVKRDDTLWVTYFADADFARIKGHQFRLLSQLWDGPKTYTARNLAVAHRMIGRDPLTGKRHNVKPGHYEKVSNYIMAALYLEHPPHWVVRSTEKLLTDSMPVICNLGKWETYTE
jgi:hypothetical protein